MNDDKITRRGLMLGGLGLIGAGCTPIAPQSGVPISLAFTGQPEIDPRFKRQQVRYDRSEKPGSIFIDTSERFLYSVEEDGWATRYGVGVGEEGRTLKGNATIGRKAEWPSWTPTEAMMKRKPRLLQYAGGVTGGPHNPLGARALYLYRGNQDTMFRLHGTNEPWSIGQAVSSGCVRLTNDDIIYLYDRVTVGTPVLII